MNQYTVFNWGARLAYERRRGGPTPRSAQSLQRGLAPRCSACALVVSRRSGHHQASPVEDRGADVARPNMDTRGVRETGGHRNIAARVRVSAGGAG